MSTLNQYPTDDGYNSVNSDFTGLRNIKDNQEFVQYSRRTSHRIWLNSQPVDFPMHWHTAIEIIVPMENIYTLITHNNRYVLNPGEILFIPSGELHAIEAPESGSRFIFIMNISTITKLKGYASIQNVFSEPLYITRDTHPMIYDDVYQILVQIRNEYYRNSDYGELTILSLLLNLLAKIADDRNNASELFPHVKLNKQKEYVNKFNQVLEYIDDHYMEDIALEDVADAAAFSKYHFSRLFKQYTGLTFWDYLCRRRIKAAEAYMADPNCSITDAAMSSGFPSISTFNRLFKRIRGCTPREYRSKNNYQNQ